MPDFVWANGLGFLAGVGPVDFEDPGKSLPESVEGQTRKVFSNLDIVLARHALQREQVVSVRIHLTQFKRFHARMVRSYAGFFDIEPGPACSCVGVTDLPREALIEMDFIVKGES